MDDGPTQRVLAKRMPRRRTRRATRSDAHAARLRRLGAALREAREARAMTLADVAAKIRRVVGSVCDYEAGRREPRTLILFDLAAALGLDLRDVAARTARRVSRVREPIGSPCAPDVNTPGA